MRPPFAALFAIAALTAAAPEWTVLNSGTTAQLRGVSAVNSQVAWASGASGTILRTSDGGLTWQPKPVHGAEKLDFRDVDAISASTAYALSIGPGPASRIYKTTDAGSTWQLQFQNDDPKAFFDAMTFWSPTHGIAIGDAVDGHFVILKTTDGGLHWQRQNVPGAQPNDGAFAASGTNIAAVGKQIWIGLGSGRVLHSTDSGLSWTPRQTGLASSASAGIFSIHFRDARHGIVVGGDYKEEDKAVTNVAITADSGLTWQVTKGLGGFRSAVTWLPSGVGWLAVGPSGSDLSKDDGRTWTPVSGPGFHTFSAAPKSKTGFGAGNGGRIGRFRW